MNSIIYRGYVITHDDTHDDIQWCVNLGLKKGIKCFSSLDDAKAAVDERISEIEKEVPE
jgi:hypothetical protein